MTTSRDRTRRHHLLTVLLGVAAPMLAGQAVAADAPRDLLVGRWKQLSTVISTDGKITTPAAGTDAYILFSDILWTSASTFPKAQSTGTYRWIAPNEIEITVLSSSTKAQNGQVSTRRIQIDRNVLTMVTTWTGAQLAKLRPFKPGELVPKEVVIANTFQRVPID